MKLSLRFSIFNKLLELEKMLILNIYLKFYILRMIILLTKLIKYPKYKIHKKTLFVLKVLIKKLFCVMKKDKPNLLNLKTFKLTKFFSYIILKFFVLILYNSKIITSYVQLVKIILLFMILLKFFIYK